MLRTLLLACLFALPAFAQYNRGAGVNAAPAQAVTETYKDDSGREQKRTVFKEAPRDGYGNAQGNQHDLAIDGAFDGQTIAVMQLYDFPFDDAKAALRQKGFGVYRWSGVPTVKQLEEGLSKACQFWLISDGTPHLTKEHVAVIKKFFDSGKGVYIWGDNEPYYADANLVGEALMGVTMLGNVMGDQVVNLSHDEAGKTIGVRRNHLLTTGLEFLYEGITIATVQKNQVLEPLLYGSAGNLVAGYFDRDGKRAIFDGGFTRLYNKWDTAGTARYVKNAAAWLVNAERFGDAVVSAKVRKSPVQ